MPKTTKAEALTGLGLVQAGEAVTLATIALNQTLLADALRFLVERTMGPEGPSQQ